MVYRILALQKGVSGHFVLIFVPILPGFLALQVKTKEFRMNKKYDFPIPFQERSPEFKAQAVAVMAIGNKILADLYEKANKENCNRAKFRGELFAKIGRTAKQVEVRGVTASEHDVAAILKVRELELPMLSSHANLISKIAHKAYNCNRGKNVELEDFFSEALVAAMNAFYLHTDTEIAFSTYLTYSVRNRLFNFSLEVQGTNTAAVKTLNEFRVRAASNPDLSREEIVAKMDMTNRQAENLESLLVHVISESGLREQGRNEEKYLLESLASKNSKSLDYDEVAAIHQAVTDAELDAWESAVLNAFLTASNDNWRSEVATQHINPATGKNYSRAAGGIALKRVQKKIKDNLRIADVA